MKCATNNKHIHIKWITEYYGGVEIIYIRRIIINFMSYLKQTWSLLYTLDLDVLDMYS